MLLESHEADILFRCNGLDLIEAIQFLGVSIQNRIYRCLIDECVTRLKSNNNLKLDVFRRKLVDHHKKIIERDPAELSQKVQHVTKDETVKEIKRVCETGHTSQTLSLKCSISQCRIKKPGKFSKCRHLAVFDVDNFLQHHCQALHNHKTTAKAPQPPPPKEREIVSFSIFCIGMTHES